MRLLKACRHRTTAWKNGGGETREILVSPSGAAFDSFDWRVSIARVDGDGPFSSFPGIDRTLTMLSGGAMTLDDGIKPVRLTPDAPPHGFDGATSIVARIEGGPVTDLNVMTRRGRLRHEVRRQHIDEQSGNWRGRDVAHPLKAGRGERLVVVIGGDVAIRATPFDGALSLHDAVLLAPDETAIFIARRAELLVIDILPGSCKPRHGAQYPAAL